MSDANPENTIEKIGKTQSTKHVASTQQIEISVDRVPPNKEKFDFLINQHQKSQSEMVSLNRSDVIKKQSLPSLMEEMRNLNLKITQAVVSPEMLSSQSRQIAAQLGDLKQKVGSSGLQLSTESQKELTNHLQHLDESLRSAMSRNGMEFELPLVAAEIDISKNPIERYLGYLTGAQEHMDHVSTKLQGLGDGMSMGQMFEIQMNLSSVTVQIEFFSSSLNKALESIKTIMQVQV